MTTTYLRGYSCCEHTYLDVVQQATCNLQCETEYHTAILSVVSQKTWGIIALNNTSGRAIAQAVIASLPSRRTEISLRSVRVGFVVGKVELRHFFPNISDSSASYDSPECSLSPSCHPDIVKWAHLWPKYRVNKSHPTFVLKRAPKWNGKILRWIFLRVIFPWIPLFDIVTCISD
jgi:hypothetical protein